ncbi:MAG TPA: PEGA domain-containing protein [Candidatus Eisenbacteria bacterium]|nr:PEGA domain-containing protein [Candidatus Eisenbacteria bacterium]
MKPVRRSTCLALLGLVGLLALSCGQKDPTFSPAALILLPQGDIVVTASVTGAAISLDGQPTGLFTPDTLLGVREGGHRVSVYRECHYPVSDSITVTPGAVLAMHFDVLPIPNTGALAVDAPWPAVIVLDGTPTDSYAPDTLCVPPGNHVVTLALPGFRSQPSSVPATVVGGGFASATFDLTVPKRVLCEDFSNYDCVPCPPAEEAMQRVIAGANGVEPGRLISINPHMYWPNPTDPLFRFNPPAHCSRKWTQSVVALPAIFVDGALAPGNPPSDTDIHTLVQARSMPTAPIAVGVTGSLVGSNYHITVDVWGVGAAVPSPLQLATCVVERSVTLATAPNGQLHYTNVLRAILPAPTVTCQAGGGVAGTAVSLAVGEHQTLQFDYAVPGGVDPAQLAVIAFLQDLSTKEVIQTGTTFDP